MYSLKENNVIVPCYHELGEFTSFIFSVPMKDGSVRLIHNLKKLRWLKTVSKTFQDVDFDRP